MIKISRPLPLKGSSNTRELGGYPIVNGKTKEHQFLRSDGLHNLTEEDTKYLFDYGVRCIIDLRSNDEVAKAPDHFGENMEEFHFPLLDGVQSNGLQGELPPSMEELYIDLLDHSQETIANVLRKMTQYEDECILFHCTAGKDRTGVTAMLLLKLAGVSDEVVIADYAATEDNIYEMFKGQIDTLRSRGIDVPDYVWESRPISMQRTLDHLYSKYEDVTKYLQSIGLTEDEIQILQNKLCNE